MKRLILLSLFVLPAFLPALAQGQPEVHAPVCVVCDTFFIELDGAGDVVKGGGSGYDGDGDGKGDWYDYDNFDWLNQWFYDGPLDEYASKQIYVSMKVRPTNATGSVTIAFNWSTDTFSKIIQPPQSPISPPLPPLDAGDEEKWIGRKVVFEELTLNEEKEVKVWVEIPNYKPEWVSIDVRGSGIEVTNGQIWQDGDADTLFGWGNNDANQIDVPPGSDFNDIAAGFCHSLALTNDGFIVAWGCNDDEQCSDIPGGADPCNGWWRSDQNDFIAIAAGGWHSLALKNDGSIVGWGWNEDGQATPPAGNDFVAIAAGRYHSLALKSNSWPSPCGSIVGWGFDPDGRATPPDGIDFVAIAAGAYHSLAIRSNSCERSGSIVGWGNNYYGQAIPPPDGADFVKIAGGGYHSIALKTNHSIVCWGRDWEGQCSGIPSGAYPCNGAWCSVQNDFNDIDAGYWHSLAVHHPNGLVEGWGENYFGQVDPRDPCENIEFSDIAAGYAHSLAVAKRRLMVLIPNGGERLAIGQKYTISWESIGNIDHVKIKYSHNKGQDWTDVNTVPNTSHCFSWFVPDPNDTNTEDPNCSGSWKQCLVRVTDPCEMHNVYDTSDDVFTIYKCRLPANVAEEGDLNDDCYVDAIDFAMFLRHWLKCGNPFECDGDPNCVDP